jgi:hypothetical protein
MFGLDVNQPLDTQLSLDGSKTWQQFFLESALNNWHWYQSMALEAQANGFVMEQTYADYLENLPASLEQSAADAGFASADAMIQADMGVAASVESWVSYWRDYYESYMYYGQEMESVQLTDAEVEAYFDAHASEYAENGLTKNEEYYVDVRHILITPTSAAGGSTYTEEEWSVAENKANEILNQWLSGAADETSFAELAEEYTMDPGSASNGGLYENVYVGQMVPEFESWCFDAARQPGDYGMVKTTYGYHLMYFVRSTPAWYLTAWQDLMSEKDHAFQEAVMEQHPIEIDYSAIALGLVNLGVTG